MANFKFHTYMSTAVSLIVGFSFYRLYILSISQTLFIISIGSVGGMLPDIDCSYSRSKSLVLLLIGVTLGLIFVFSFVVELGILLSLFLGLCIHLFFYKYVRSLTNNIFVHRGIMHSIPMALICSFLLIFIVYALTFDLLFSWLSGILLMLSYLMHLFIDECCSINFSKINLKKSFGSALSLFSCKSIMLYILIYIFLLLLFLFLPKDNILIILKSKFILKDLLYNLLPSRCCR